MTLITQQGVSGAGGLAVENFETLQCPQMEAANSGSKHAVFLG